MDHRQTNETALPIRMKLREAAKLLGMSKQVLYRIAVEDGEFTILRNEKARRGDRSPIYLLTEEVLVFAKAEDGTLALREFRAKRKRRRKVPA
jgi:hypothetical protein